MKGTKRRARAQAVVRELAEHANEIKTIGRQTFDGLVEIGRRLVRCRELLKPEREWLAWLKAEFSWSRSHADNLIAVYTRRDKLRKFRNLNVPLSALYLLTKAPPKALIITEQSIRAGERPTVSTVDRIAKQQRDRARITITEPASPQDGPRRSFSGGGWSSDEAHRPALVGADFQVIEARRVVGWLKSWAHDLDGRDPGYDGDGVPAELRADACAHARAVADYLNKFVRSLPEEGTPPRPKLLTDGTDAALTKV
jgi:hypothetical protein